MNVPGLAERVPVEVLDEDVPDEFIERVVEAADGIPRETLDELRRATVRYCEWMRERWPGDDFPVPAGVRPADILNHVRAGCLCVQEPEGEGVPVRFELNCDWEREHGLEWLLRDGVILYVGPFVMAYEWDDLADYRTQPGNFAWNG